MGRARILWNGCEGLALEVHLKNPLVLRPRARRVVVNVPPTTFPFLSSVLTNSTNSCSLIPLTDCLLKQLPLMEAEAQKSNSLLLPGFSENKASNHKFCNSVCNDVWGAFGRIGKNRKCKCCNMKLMFHGCCTDERKFSVPLFLIFKNNF